MKTDTPVKIPKESVSDDSVLLVRWMAPDHAQVEKGAVIAVIETSKSAIDVEAPEAGYLSHLYREGDRIAVGSDFALISNDPTRRAAITREREVQESNDGKDLDARFSKAARALVKDHRLDPAIFGHLPVVQRSDVEEYLRKKSEVEHPLLENLPVATADDVMIWGGGGHAKVCIEIFKVAYGRLPYGIIDAHLPIGTRVLGVPVIGRESALELLRDRGVRNAVLGIGAVLAHGSRSTMLARLRKAGYRLPNLIHPKAAIDESVRLGEGNVVFANATVSADVVIGDGCILNSGSVVSHDCCLGSNVHLAPGALLAGAVKVGDDTLIGMAATVFLKTTIGRGVRINNGASVEGDVPDGSIIRR